MEAYAVTTEANRSRLQGSHWFDRIVIVKTVNDINSSKNSETQGCQLDFELRDRRHKENW
ncbi:hypothetical protein ACTXT7_010362 [Hymenolepis weldensis]